MLHRIWSRCVSKMVSWWNSTENEPVDRQISADEFWLAHVRTGAALGCLSATITAAYFLMIPAGERRPILVAALVAGLLVNVGVGFTAARMRRPRTRMVTLRIWLALVLVVLTILAALDGGAASPLAMFVPAPVMFAALAHSTRHVVMFALVAIGVEATLPVIGDGGYPADAGTRSAIAIVMCLLSIGAAVNRQRYDHLIGKLTDQLTEQAAIDALTGLPNRRSELERLDQEILRCRRTGATFLLAIFDLDRFKTVNDAYGHAAGDELLRAVGRSVRAALRATDFVSRTGGDEFTVICPDVDDAQADLVADKIRSATAAADPRGVVTASVGVAAFADPAETSDGITLRADLAMYENKSRQKPTKHPAGDLAGDSE